MSTPQFSTASKLYLQIVIGVLALSLFAIFAYQPLHGWETGIYVAVLSLPILALIFFVVRAKAAQANIPNWTPQSIALWSAILAVFPVIAIVFVANVVLDKAPPQDMRIEIADKGLNHLARHHHFLSYFPSPAPSPLPFAFSRYESADIQRADYDTVIPGVTHIQIALHSGALGFAWYGHGYTYDNRPG